MPHEDIHMIFLVGGCQGFLIGDLVDRVIFDIMVDHQWPEGRCPESFVLISLSEVCKEWGILHGIVLGGGWGFLTWDIEDKVMLEVGNVLGIPQESDFENYVTLF